MLVLTQVSAMKTRRLGSTSPRYFSPCARRRATSARSCSLAIRVFFMRQVLGVDERPHHAIVDLQSPLGQFTDQTAQREGAIAAALQQPGPPGASDLLRAMTAHLTSRDVARSTPPLHLLDDRAGAKAEALRRRAARQLLLHNGFDNTLTQIGRVGLRHSCWPPSQPAG
jgi:hypothetical protein